MKALSSKTLGLIGSRKTFQKDQNTPMSGTFYWNCDHNREAGTLTALIG